VPISGLVVVFQSGGASHDAAILQLASHPSIQVGKRGKDQVAIVIDSDSVEHDREINTWVQSLPGVTEIRIAFVGIDDAENSSCLNSNLRTRPWMPNDEAF
jgi:nitrate reductase NapAB chaperone NapD